MTNQRSFPLHISQFYDSYLTTKYSLSQNNCEIAYKSIRILKQAKYINIKVRNKKIIIARNICILANNFIKEIHLIRRLCGIKDCLDKTFFINFLINS